MGWGKIAHSLNDLGFQTMNGKQFYKMTVKRLFMAKSKT